MNTTSHIRLIAGIVLLVLLPSCENEIPYNTDGISPKLTMSAFIYADSLKNRLYLSMTGEAAIQSVSNSRVEVRVDGELRETLDALREEGTPLRSVEITTRFRPGDKVRIDAYTIDGRHRAWIEETVPVPVAIEKIDTGTVISRPTPYYNYTSEMLRVKVHFTDPPGGKNYYRIMLEERCRMKEERSDAGRSVEEKSYNFWPWEDIALTDGRPTTTEELGIEIFERVTNRYGVFDDSWFRDSPYTLNVLAPLEGYSYSGKPDFRPQYRDVDLAVRLLSITETEFYYLTTMNMIDSDVLDDYISDPVKIPSNVHGGIGFVGISSESGTVIRWIENEKMQYTDH